MFNDDNKEDLVEIENSDNEIDDVIDDSSIEESNDNNIIVEPSIEIKNDDANSSQIADNNNPKSISSVLSLKLKKKKTLAKMSTVKNGGIAAEKKATEAIKTRKLEEKRALQLEKQSKQKAFEKEQMLKRLEHVILIGKAKVPSPELGCFEIRNSKIQDKPYKLVLKTNTGKVIFETSPIKTKPNELTALMIKDILEKGSFSFIRNLNGFTFKILDERKRLFYTSHPYKTLLDAQKAAATIKKFGLSANYIDDIT